VESARPTSCTLLAFVRFTALACAVNGCEPRLSVGEWECRASTGPIESIDGAGGEGSVSPVWSEPVPAPWSTGFEDGFCGYTRARGFCYSNTDASYELVNSPVRSGRYAAAFKVTSDAAQDGIQARCVREGVLPSAAYYGAWYYIPSTSTNTGNWNLLHFQGGETSELHGLWDVSVASGVDGRLSLYLFDFLRDIGRHADAPPEVPIGSWFHVEFYFKRAADLTGEVALYQDGELTLRLTDLETDDSLWGQWYVGNLADALVPAESTVYVDDVTIREVP
jgi:hypothetical protein